MKPTPATSSEGPAINSLLIDAMPGNHLVLLSDAPTFTIAAVSDEYLVAVGLQRESLLGRGLFEVFFPDGHNPISSEQLRQSLTQVIDTKRPHLMTDQRYQWPNVETGLPEWRSWRVVNKPVDGPDGKLLYIIHTIHDVTPETMLVEVARDNQYLQAIINSFKEPMQVLQPVFEQGELVDFRYALTNQAYAAYANATPDELKGRRVGDVFPGYFDTVSFTNPVETYKTGQPLTFEIHYDKDGLDLYNLMSTAKLEEEVIVHFTDFTRLRQLQHQLEGKIDELKRSNDDLQQFAYVASHDLQEPLRKIQAFGTLLQAQYAPALGQGADLVERMQSAALRMTTLIRDLLTFAQITAQRGTGEPTALASVIDLILTDLDVLISETEATIQIGALPVVKGDASQLGQLFQNLLSNALKFRLPTRKAQINIDATVVDRSHLPPGVKPAQSAEAYHRVDVADNGIGFEQQYAERIFQVFQRLHGQSNYTGTGIGLAICEKVATNHGGAITARGQLGQGATFSVYLPV
ncbi:sensor histidine kinase [Fibrella arboris]|uniref:sensor histidine kinase n=1 Tax=Fibrella arboris TaxID=3242486 RepID=UPI0035221BD7